MNTKTKSEPQKKLVVHSANAVMRAGGLAAYARKIGHQPVTEKIAGTIRISDRDMKKSKKSLTRSSSFPVAVLYDTNILVYIIRDTSLGAKKSGIW